MRHGRLAPVPWLKINSNGVTAAIAPARREIIEFLSALSPTCLSRLSEYRIVFDIIPNELRITHLSGYKSELSCTAGYQSHNIRAFAVFPRGKTIRFAIGEERLCYPHRQCPRGYDGLPKNSIAHEVAHIVQYVALSAHQIRLIQELFQERLSSQRAWLDDYAKTDWHEYFAESVTAYLGYPQHPHQSKRYTRQWLRRNDPRMLSLLMTIFPPADSCLIRTSQDTCCIESGASMSHDAR